MLYTVSNKFLSLTVNSSGGSMTSLKYLPTGEERLWQGNEFWGSQDVVIFPIVGHAGAFTAKGKSYSPRSHGVARYAEFEPVNVSEEAITLAIKSNADTLSAYPYGFEFSITYTLDGNSVKIEYFVRAGEGETQIPFYVGGHPGMVAKGGEAIIEFENEEQPLMYPLDSADALPIGNLKRFVANKQFFAECKTLQLGNLSGGAIYAETTDGYRYTYRSNCPLVAFWSNEKGGDYVCVEPWWGINDFSSAPRELTLKPFINFADNSGKKFAFTLAIDKI